MVLAFSALLLLDDVKKLNLPEWVVILFIVPGVVTFFIFLYALATGLADLAIHFIPESRFRKAFVEGWGGRSTQDIADEFSKTGYRLAWLPFAAIGAVCGLALIVLLAIGGIALLSSVVGGIFAGWPTWAIVITILLVLILLKK